MNTAEIRIIAAMTAIVLGAAGCASAPERPDQQLARAETSIEFAEENGAREFGLAALDRAQENLRLAQQSAEAGEYEKSLRFAQKAEIDAELAAAQSNTGKAREALEEIMESIATLRREIAQTELNRGGHS
jgi:tetratricopeptide (TPR) repeat protein